ncbi:MAG: hypothetical protein GY775_05825 [Candidatus Scalindua sp.]|nr:hypothetical protein [Candidatus Scalindua sp.]
MPFGRESKIVNLKSHDGYVLVVIIGILTILSLMTITFATLSRIETRATRNYTDSVKCEQVAKAGLEHAIYEIWLDKFGTDTLAYNDNDGSNPGQYGLDENFDSSGTSWPGNSVFPDTGTDDYDNDGDTTDDSTWVYFPATDSLSDIRLPGKLRARYAVLITDDREARVNINVTGNKAGGPSHASNEGWSTFEIDLSDLIEREVGNGTTIANLIIDARHGNGGNPQPGTSTVNDDTGIVPDPEADDIDNDLDWTIGDDTNLNGIPDSGEAGVDELDTSEYIDEPSEFNAIFPYGDDVPFGILSEAEIMGTTSYESRLEKIFTDNIVPEDALNSWVTTYSADTILCPSYQSDGSTSTTKLNINALVNNEGKYDDGGAYYNTDRKVLMLVDAFTAGGVPDVERQQMAVNIIDFIDSDDTVTKYPESLTPPVYYGVERTPYINEVEAKVNGGRDRYIELFNPYDEAVGENWTIKLDGGAGAEIVLTGDVPAKGYYVIDETGAEGGNQSDFAVGSLDNNGEVLILEDDNGNVMQKTDYGSANNGQSRQLNDPRPIPLTASAADPWEWTSAGRTSGAENQNSVFNPDDGDWTDAIYLPSFLVANRRFSNIGYLGFIHRGSEWSSFDVRDTIIYPDVLQYITVTDPSMDNIDNDGDFGTDTADTGLQAGDFDGPEYRIPGLINVNTASVAVLESLPDGSGGTLGNAIAIAIQGSGSKPFKSIGDLVDNVTQITGVGTKWVEEERFRAISNLITTRSNVFTVYVTAQITEDDVSDPPNTTVYAEKRILAIVDRSVNPIKVRYFRWLVE